MTGSSPLPNRILPATDRPTIDMHEVRTWVVTDASATEAQCGIAELPQVTPLRSQIDRHTFDMIAAFCDTLVLHIESRIGGWRAITANHQKRIVGVEPLSQIPKQVEDAGIHGSDFVRVVIPQDPIDVSDGLTNVVTVGPVDGPQPLAGMDIV